MCMRRRGIRLGIGRDQPGSGLRRKNAATATATMTVSAGIPDQSARTAVHVGYRVESDVFYFPLLASILQGSRDSEK